MLKLQASTSVGLYRQIIADKDSILESVPRLRPADLISRLEVLESQVYLTLNPKRQQSVLEILDVT